jgi:hypothetical protein
VIALRKNPALKPITLAAINPAVTTTSKLFMARDFLPVSCVRSPHPGKQIRYMIGTIVCINETCDFGGMPGLFGTGKEIMLLIVQESASRIE